MVQYPKFANQAQLFGFFGFFVGVGSYEGLEKGVDNVLFFNQQQNIRLVSAFIMQHMIVSMASSHITWSTRRKSCPCFAVVEWPCANLVDVSRSAFYPTFQNFDAACNVVLLALGGNIAAALTVFKKRAAPVTWLFYGEYEKGRLVAKRVRSDDHSFNEVLELVKHRGEKRGVPGQGGGGGCFLRAPAPIAVAGHTVCVLSLY